MASLEDQIQSLSYTVKILSAQVASTQPNALALQQLTNIIDQQLDQVMADLNIHETEIQDLQSQMAIITPSGLITQGIYSLNGIANPSGDVEIIAGSGISITNDTATKRITISTL